MVPQLKKLGLSDGEAKVYLATLELGQASVHRIAQKARLKRTTVYGLIEALKEMGLVKVTRAGKRNFYYTEDPHRFLDLTTERSKLAESLLPALIALNGIGDHKPKILYFEGMEGMKNLYKETLAFPDSTISSWLSASSFNLEGEWFNNYYRPARIKKKIYTQAIVPDTETTRTYHAKDTEEFHKTRIETGGNLVVESDILLFGNRYVALLSWEEMVGMVVESKKIHDTLQSIFTIHWNSLESA